MDLSIRSSVAQIAAAILEGDEYGRPDLADQLRGLGAFYAGRRRLDPTQWPWRLRANTVVRVANFARGWDEGRDRAKPPEVFPQDLHVNHIPE